MGQPDKAERFVSMSITLPFEEVKDERGEDSVPELRHVAELRDAGNMQDAIDYGMSLMKMYPDNDLIPFMIGYIYYQKQFPREAIQLAINAIPNCPRKYRLYSLAGLGEFEQNHMPEALVWWSRSIIAQCIVVDYQEYDPFLHMAHAAQAIDAKREAQLLYTMTDAIEASTPRLDGPAAQKVAGIRTTWVAKPLGEVLHHLDEKYLHG
jgi:tetratricopeptide (TPR) repeat protein